MSVTPIVLRYISEVADSYVYAEEGLPIEYHGVEGEEAENLAAWATQLAANAGEKLGLPKPVVAVFLARGRDIVAYVEGRESVVALVAEGHGEPVARALRGRGPRCEKCGADLSMTLVVCPKCGAKNPFTAAYCRRCGAPIRYRKCPSCGSSLDAEGRLVGLADRLLGRPAETVIVTGTPR